MKLKIFITMLCLTLHVFALENKLFFNPSYDCNHVQNDKSVEWKICTSKVLSALDRELDYEYNIAISIFFATGLKESQLDWLKHRNNCKTLACIQGTYVRRLIYLKDDIYFDINQSLCSDFLDAKLRKEILLSSDKIKNEFYDINNDGKKEKVVIKQNMGSAVRQNEIEFYDSLTGKAMTYIAYEPAIFTSERNVFEYKGQFYVVHYEDIDEEKPQFITYIDKHNIERPVCKFKTIIKLDNNRGIKDAHYSEIYGSLLLKTNKQ